MASRNNPGSGKGRNKIWSDAIRKAVNELRENGDDPKKVKALGLLANKLVSKALEGEMAALKEIGDRLEGRPSQSVTGEGGGPVQIIVATGIPRDDD